MKLPTQRITITPSEYMLLRPGLDLLRNRFAEAESGSFPHCNFAFRAENNATAIYKIRAYDESMKLRLANVQQKLHGIETSRKVRFDEFEFLAVAFALRLLRLTGQPRPIEIEPVRYSALAQKLEKFRKRAKRATIESFGADVHHALSHKWKAFTAWMRYFLLQTGVPNFGPSAVAMLQHNQMVQMTAILEGIVRAAFYNPLEAAQMKRLVSLVLRTIRRGRRQTTLRGLLEDPSRHTAMLLKFVSDRANLQKGPDFPKERWELIMERGEKFRAYAEAKRNGTLKPRVAQPLVSIAEVPVTEICPPLISPMVPESPPAPHSPAWDETLWNFLAEWFYQDVPRSFWKQIVDRIYYLERFESLSRFNVVTYPTRNFNKLFAECRPFYDADPVDFYSTQVLRFLLALGRERDRLASDMRIVATRAAAGSVHI